MRTPDRVALLVALPAVVLGLAACSAPEPLPVPVRSAAVTATPTPSPTPRLDVARVAGLARTATGSGTVVSVEDEADGSSWEVHVVDAAGAEQELHLDAAGVVRAGPTPDDADADRRADNRAAVAAASVTLASARNRMVAAVAGGRVTAIALGVYHQRYTWTGDVVDPEGVRHDVRVDAVSGGVVLQRADRPDPQPTATGS